MTFCTFLTVLAVVALLLAALPYLLEALAGRLRDLAPRFCRLLCRWWIVLAFLVGLALGGLVFCCWPELRAWLAGSACRRWILLAFLLLFWLLYQLVRWFGRCTLDNQPRLPLPSRDSTVQRSIPLLWLLLLLLAVLLALIRWCCRGAAAGPGWTLCHTLLLVLVVLFLLLAAVRFFAERLCAEGEVRDCRGRLLRLAWAAILVALVLIVLVIVCCRELIDRDYDLAMVGIWWEGGYQGEAGAHLRWGFRIAENAAGDPPLPFPQDGFDLQRRESGTGAWTALNPERIRPAPVWGDETAVAGEMWRNEGVERLHPDAWDQFRGVPFSDLVDMVGRDPYVPLYFVEETDPAEFALAPSNPYGDEATRDAYLASYYAAGTEEEPMRPLAVWTWEPMTAIAAAALFPEVARLVGLYYIDREADPNVEYDYRVIGYWADATRSYTVERISRPNTAPLDPPVVTRTDSPVEVGELPGGVTLIDDQAVGLTWTPPDVADPDDLFGPIDRIDSVVFRVEHKPLDGSGAPPACPASTDAAGFEPARRPAAEGEGLEEIPPVTVSAVEDEITGDLSWPEHYFFHRDLDYGCHGYRVLGQDVFGRPAPPSGPTTATVADLTGPPPPALVRATVYQRADDTLPADVRAAYLPDGAPTTYALVVSWVWTDAMDERVDDEKEFSVYLRHTAHETFVDPSGPALWRDAAVWDLQLGPAVGFADTLPMPPRLTGLPEPISGRYYEVVLTDDDFPPAALGLAAGDSEPVEYAWVGVATTDHDPYNNQGAVSAPVLAFARDLTPPDPPDPPPAQVGEPAPADDRGNRTVRLAWPGAALYTYQLHRVDVADLGPIVADPDPADLPACLAGEAPACDPATGGETCLDEHEEFAIRATAALDPGGFGRVSPLPIEVAAGQAEHVDAVDATSSRRFLYAAKAVDAAGNASELSCPSAVVLVPDGVPPRPPVWTEVVAGDGAIELTWAVNPEADLDHYTIYRTAVEASAASRRKMVELVRLRPDGTAVTAGPDAAPGGAGAYATLRWADAGADPGTTYWFRLDAVDFAGNRSPLSAIASARAFDATPPAAPLWAASALTAGTGGDGRPEVALAWHAVAGDPDLRILVQRRIAGERAWRSLGGWLEPGLTAYTDAGLTPGRTYEYRLRAMDPGGNRSGFSAVETIAVP